MTARCQFCSARLATDKPEPLDNEDLWPICKPCADSYPCGDEAAEEEKHAWWQDVDVRSLTPLAAWVYHHDTHT